jgi:hypothetical protein
LDWFVFVDINRYNCIHIYWSEWVLKSKFISKEKQLCSGWLFSWIARRIRNSTKLNLHKGPSWSWSYGSWIYNDRCNQCISPLTLRVRIAHRRGVLDTTLVIKFVSDLRQVVGFLWALRFPPPITLTTTI